MGLGGLLTNRVTGEERVQGANRLGGFGDWTGLVNYSDIPDHGPPVTEDQAMGLPGVGRGVRLVCTVVAGLTPYRVRHADSVSRPTEVLDPNTLLANPDPTWHGPAAWTWAAVRDLQLYGNTFADRAAELDRNGLPTMLPLIPARCVSWDKSSSDPDRKVYWRRHDDGTRTEVEPADMWHAVVNPRPGKRMGVGILGQYQTELRTMLAVEKAQWVVMSKGRPVGVLSMDVDGMLDTELRDAKKAFLDGVRRDGIAALVKAKFDSVSWSATDLALTDARTFNLRLAADITGVLPHLLGVPSESRVYSNLSEEWTTWITITVNQFLLGLQDAWASCFPRGTGVDYDDERLRRPDAKTRWQIYRIARDIDAMSVAEIRQAERMGPRTPDEPEEDPAP